ncbi:MAG: hypothetical protein LBR81_05695 [Prevotellaceae bacterium]|jgi:hypothetical protein|nr:hypothetical protein [Prevotellaceae bacterium]
MNALKKTNIIPSIINGIPTDKNATEQRREIVKNTYFKLLERLQRTKGEKTIFNDFLGVDVHILMRESGKKASNGSTKYWQSTYAVQHLEKVIRNAKPLPNVPIYKIPKSTGKQKEFNYVNLATLFYEFKSEELDYMNFTVKLTLGIKNDGRHIQYSISKIEVQFLEKENTL